MTIRSRSIGQPTLDSWANFCQCSGVILSMESLFPILMAGVLESSGQASVQTRSQNGASLRSAWR